MNRIELENFLQENKIPKGSYSLNGNRYGECLCLIEEKDNFKIIYNSRGHLEEISTHENEKTACTAFLKELCDVYPRLKNQKES